MSPVLGHWKMRSCGQCIRLILAFVDEKYEEKVYKFGPAPDYNQDEWMEDKFTLGLDFPCLPYYIDEDVKLSRNSTIMKYLATKHKLDGKTSDERLRVHILEHQLHELNNKWDHLCYNKDFETRKIPYIHQLDNELRYISEYLESRKFFAGSEVTFVDFLAYEYISQHQLLQSNCLDPFKNLKLFKERIEDLPRVGEYIRTSPTLKYPIHEPIAYFSNK